MNCNSLYIYVATCDDLVVFLLITVSADALCTANCKYSQQSAISVPTVCSIKHMHTN